MLFKKILTIIICVVMLAGCEAQNYSTENNDDYDYSLNHVELGLSYVPDSNAKFRESTAEHINELGIKHVRVGQLWSFREPVQGEYNMQPIVDRLDFYAANSVKVLMTIDLKEIPDWAYELSEADFLISFEAFIDTMLSEYGEKISMVQMGNEWDWEVDKQLSGDVSRFIKMNNILYDAVLKMGVGRRPTVVLGSISMGGLHALAYNQGKIENIYFDGKAVYSEDELKESRADIDEAINKTRRILSECKFDGVDVHLYDDYWSWHHYIDAMKDALSAVGKKRDMLIIASEFGGPSPDWEPRDEAFKADALYNYIKTIDELKIDIAYFFKLHEHTSDDPIYHPDSFLISKNYLITKSYEVIQEFAKSD